MPGPLPKPPQQRVRRNKTATAATLNAAEAPLTDPDAWPELPKRGRKTWHPFVLTWWADLWHSPMAHEFLRQDLHQLYLLADLHDQYWRKPSAKLAAEIRQQGQRFGLSPMDRRRLQWEIEREPEQRAAPTPPPSAPKQPREDPRRHLRAVG